MADRRMTRRKLLWAAGIFALGSTAGKKNRFPTSAPSTRPTSRPTTQAAAATTAPTSQPSAKTLAKIRELEKYYAKLYGEPLTRPERLPKQIAVVSLSRIMAPETTARLLEVFKSKDHDPVVWYLAWEALHHRYTTMNAEQRGRWVVGGLIAANLGGFPGATVIPLLYALAEHQPTAYEAEPHKLAFRVVQENELQQPGGRKALESLRQLVAAWHDPAMIRMLAGSMTTRPELTEKIDYVLGGLPSPPVSNDSKKRSASAWAGWMQQHSSMKVAATEDLKPYSGTANVFPAPLKIVNPDDRQWTQELEIGKVNVSDFDLVWCIDSTGSMHETNQLVASETATVIRVCSLISRQARCGTVYYRHELEPGLMQKCCLDAKNNSKFYCVKGLKLTADGRDLATKMAAERIPKPDKQVEGNVHPGCAYYSGLKASMEFMNWSTDKQARRVIVMIGDSFLTPDTEKQCVELSAKAKASGYQLHALIRNKAIGAWDEAVKAGGHTPLILNVKHSGGSEASNDFRKVAAEVIAQAVAAPYRDRVTPLLMILMPYAKELNEAERRLKPDKKETKPEAKKEAAMPK